MKRLSAIFSTLNVFMLILWMSITHHSPSLLYVTLDAPQGAVLTTVGGRKIAVSPNDRTPQRIILPSDFVENEIPLKLEGTTSDVSFVHISLVRRFFITNEWEREQIHRSGERTAFVRRSESNPRMSSKCVLVLMAAEMLVLFLSVIIAALARKLKDPCVGTRTIILTAIAFAWIVVVVTPLQTLSGNAAALDLSLAPVLGESALSFVVTLLSLITLLLVSRRCAGSFLVVLVGALTAYEYLELGILSFDMPVLDGDIFFFLNTTRGLVDLSVLLAIIIAYAICNHYCKPFLLWAAGSILILSTASIFDARTSIAETSQGAPGVPLHPNTHVVSSCIHSAQKNIAFYILDCVSTEHACHVFAHDPEIVREFDGFVCFTNNVGMSMGTLQCVAGITTGRYLQDPTQLATYGYSCFESNSFVRAYLDNGADVFFSPGSFPFGISTRCQATETTRVASPFFKRMADQQQWNLFELCRFRLMPFIGKIYIYRLTMSGWDKSCSAFDECSCYPLIETAPVDSASRLTLQFWHTAGSHPPMGVNRCGVDDGVVRTGYEAKIEKTWHALSRLTELLRTLKRRGIYDTTFIILAADHGSVPIHAVNPSIPQVATPMLLVKPLNSHGKMRYSNVPTSHAKIYELTMELLRSDVGGNETELILKEERRRFVDGSNEWIISSDGRCKMHTTSSEDAIVKLPAIKMNHTYSLYASNRDDIPPVKYTNLGYFGGGRSPLQLNNTGPEEPLFSMLFRTSASSQKYLLRLEIRSSGHRSAVDQFGFLLRLEDNQSQMMAGLPYRENGLGWIELEVLSDKDGIVRVNGCTKSHAEFRTMELREVEGGK